MSTIRGQMKELLGETSVEAGTEESPEPKEMYKPLIQQLVLAMQATGLSPDDDEHVDSFLKMLKTISTTKSSMFKTALRLWTGSRATRAVKTAKLSL